MKRTLLAAAASLALIVPAGVAFAQDAVVATDTAGNTVVLTAGQQTAYDGWPADRRTSYDAWPTTYRTYFWTLTPEQQAGWWVLTDEQRTQVYGLTPEQRTAAWASITQQMAAAQANTAPTGTTTGMTPPAADPAASDPNTPPSDPGPTGSDMSATATADPGMTGTTAGPAATTAMPAATMGTASPGQMQFVRRESAQAVPASADAAALASGDLPVCKKGQQDGCINSYEKTGRGTKPLSYWPGKPASEIPGSKPEPAATTPQ